MCHLDLFMTGHRTIWQQFFCLLLCVSAWRGPVLMLHHHDAFPDADLREQHVHQFHGDECCEDDGVHWHFGNPKDLTGRTMFPEDQVPVDSAAFATNAVTCSFAVHAWALLPVFHETCANGLIEPGETSHPATFHFAYGPCDFVASLLMAAPLVCVTGVCIV